MKPATQNSPIQALANPSNTASLSTSGLRVVRPLEKSIVELFEVAASAFPDRVAIECGSSQWTYRELNRRANGLARKLREHRVRPETMVGVCIERSPEMILAILAILKAGGAYVPFDSEYPRERLAFMLKDTNAPLVITQKSLASAIPADRSVASILIDAEESEGAFADDENPVSGTTPQSLAYVMYTSGSTGMPKGVLIENRSVVRLVFETNYCHFGPEEVFLQFAPISFDASTLEIWGALLHGGKLVVMPPKFSSLDELGRTIGQHGVSTLWLTAGLFHLFVDERLEDLRPIKQLLAGGDVLSASHVRKVLGHLPDLTLINGYGPTEGTTFTCCHMMRSGDAVPDSVPIGKPISHTYVRLLDENLQAVVDGQIGELCAGGDGIARGYLNAPELSAEKFIPDPFLKSADARLYRTGDLARRTDDGTIEFLGRKDNQVKILGHRIEPGEIEVVLNQHPGIRQSCVAVNADGAGIKRLVGYFVAGRNGAGSTNEIRDYLAARLPSYMIPASMIPLTSFPLSPNGKIDRAALPSPESASAHSSHQQPQSELEQTIAGLWKKVLKVENTGLDENFFDLGGDSLLLVAVHSQLQKILQTEIPVTDLFDQTTIRALAQHLAKSNPEKETFSEVQEQAQRQRAAIAKMKQAHSARTS